MLRPQDARELAVAIQVLKNEFDIQKYHEKKKSDVNVEGLFAVRGGGHSPVAGASTSNGGVLIDLSLLNQVIISPGRETVVIGAGCKWARVYEALEKQELGGRRWWLDPRRWTIVLFPKIRSRVF